MNKLNHVAFIMDGNGRWGKKRKRGRNYGHLKGVETVEKIVKASLKLKIPVVTFYVFSTENWKRPKKEINFLFNLLENFLLNKISDLNKQNIKLKVIGKKKFSSKLTKLLNLSEKKAHYALLMKFKQALVALVNGLHTNITTSARICYA